MVPLEAFRAKFPWARFLAEGGFKQVYMVFNAEMQRSEAVSVMDMAAMEELGNVAVADSEVQLSLLPSMFSLSLAFARAHTHTHTHTHRYGCRFCCQGSSSAAIARTLYKSISSCGPPNPRRQNGAMPTTRNQKDGSARFCGRWPGAQGHGGKRVDRSKSGKGTISIFAWSFAMAATSRRRCERTPSRRCAWLLS